ncbi:MAG: HAL/PAL/TAL family ammonia-lyase, partial [Aestuariivirgaceae bacterium]
REPHGGSQMKQTCSTKVSSARMIRITLDGQSLDPATVERIAMNEAPVEIAGATRKAVAAGRRIVERYVKENLPAYGLTTGLGARVGEMLPKEAIADFSYRMIRGRAQGLGRPLSERAARAVMAVRLNTMLSGAAGQSIGLVDHLAEALNRQLAAVIPSTASIGATDLVAMAALGHGLIGEGEMLFRGKRMPAAKALQAAGLAPIKLGPKDGQVLCNNTAFTAGLAALATVRAERAIESHIVAGALSLEGFRGNSSPLQPRVLALRPHAGEAEAGRRIRRLLSSGLLLKKGEARRLQDPLSFRCMAQVFGAALAESERLRKAVTIEINGSSDNPAVIEAEDHIVTTGNFHLLQLSLAADSLARALAWCATDSVSRVARLMAPGFSGLPPLLSSDATERGGFGPLMKPAEALRAEIIHLANPVPVMASHNADGQEDSLSHAPLAVQKLEELLERYELAVAMELVAAAQAVDLAKPRRIAPRLAKVHAAVRTLHRFIDEDHPVGREIEAVAEQIVRSGMLLQL